MTKAEIVNIIAKKTEMEKSTVKIVVYSFCDVVCEALKKGDKVVLNGLKGTGDGGHNNC